MTEDRPFSFDWALWYQWIMATTMGWVLGRILFPNLAFAVIGLALGALQFLILKSHIRDAWRWVIATTFGWTFGSMLLLTAVPAELEFLSGVVVGLTTGTAQWIILRRQIHWSGWWILMSVVGWTTGLSLLPGLFLTGVMAGVVTGVPMGLLLQFPKPPEPQEEQAYG